MTFLKKILKAPVSKTLIIMLISATLYVIFVTCLNYFLRVMCVDAPQTTGACQGTDLQRLASQVVGDFVQLARITFVLSTIILISQFVYRVIKPAEA